MINIKGVENIANQVRGIAEVAWDDARKSDNFSDAVEKYHQNIINALYNVLSSGRKEVFQQILNEESDKQQTKGRDNE